MQFSKYKWNCHRKGEETRARILEELRKNPRVSVKELSQLCGRCERQVRRQLSTIRQQGLGGFFFEASPICHN